jgi:hypothetical protein
VLGALLLAAWWSRTPAPPPEPAAPEPWVEPPTSRVEPLAAAGWPEAVPSVAPHVEADPMAPVRRTVACGAVALEGATEVRIGESPWHGPITVEVTDGAFEVPLPLVDPSPGHALRYRRSIFDGGETPVAVEEGGLAFGDVVTVPLDVPGLGRTTALLQQVDGAWTCAVDAPEPYVFVSGVVHGGAGVDVWIGGCGTYGYAEDDGTYALEISPGSCTLQALRDDGTFRLPSDPVVIDAEPGDELVVDFTLPRWRAAGVGVVVETGPDGVEIQVLVPGGPASLAGLQPGDLVIELDGFDVAGLSDEDWLTLGIGPEGTEVTYTVVRDDEVLDVAMVRSALDPREPDAGAPAGRTAAELTDGLREAREQLEELGYADEEP